MRQRIGVWKQVKAVCILALAAGMISGCSLKTAENREALRMSGIEKLDAGDYAGAISDLEEALDLGKGRVGSMELDILKYRAEAEYKIGDYRAAAHTYDVLSQVDGEKPEYAGLHCLLSIRAGDTEEALEAYQRVYRQYDASSINDIPVEVFYKELARYQPLVNNAKEAFADPKTGMAPGVMGLTAEDMQNFYSQLPKRLESVIWLEQSGKPGYEQAQAIAQKKFDAVQRPFTYSFGVSPDAMDYQTLLSLLLTLLCAVIAAPVFASDAQTGAQDIQLCTKNGGLRLAAAKLAAAFSITGAAYLLCGVVWILVTNALFGWESTQTSVQWLFSVTSLLPYTVGQMEWVMLVANFLIFFAEVAFVLMASVWAKNNLTALSVALISVVAPLIVYMVVPGSFGEWLSTLIPAGGIGLSNALLYKMISFDFLYAGGHAFFQADVLLASAPIKIVLLVGLAAWGYLRKTKVA